MMAMTRMLAVPSLVLALGLIGAPSAKAAAITINAVGVVNATYDAATGAAVPTDTVTGPNVIQFEGVDTGTIEPGNVVRLGQLDIRPPRFDRVPWLGSSRLVSIRCRAR